MEKGDGRAIFARTLRSPFLSPPCSISLFLPLFLDVRCRVTSHGGAEPVAPRQVTVRNTTVRCGHLSLSRVASRNKTFLSPHGNGKRLQEEEEERCEKSKRRSVQPHAVGCRGCSRIDSFLLRRIGVRSACSLPSLFAQHIPASLLYLSLWTYSVFPSPRPIYLPPRVAEWILFVSHRYFSGARLPFTLQNCLAATIYVSSDPAAD